MSQGRYLSPIKAFKWLLASLIALPILLYLFLLLANLVDEEKSQRTIAFEAFLAGEGAPADKDNAYVYLMGLNENSDKDLFALGQERIALLTKRKLANKDLANKELEQKERLTIDFQGLNKLLEACSIDKPLMLACQQSLLSQQTEIADLLKAQQLLLSRYQQVFKLNAWREHLPQDVEMLGSGLDYQQINLVNKLALLAMWQQVQQGESQNALRQLQQQLSFNRMVLASSNVLISKMMAVNAIKHDLVWAEFIIKQAHGQGDSVTIPQALLSPLSDDELSLANVAVGEWQFAKTMFATLGNDEQLSGRLMELFLLPLLKDNATANLHAEMLAIDYRITQGISPCKSIAELKIAEFIYNPLGKILICSGYGHVNGYIVKLNELAALQQSIAARLTS